MPKGYSSSPHRHSRKNKVRNHLSRQKIVDRQSTRQRYGQASHDLQKTLLEAESLRVRQLLSWVHHERVGRPHSSRWVSWYLGIRLSWRRPQELAGLNRQIVRWFDWRSPQKEGIPSQQTHVYADFGRHLFRGRHQSRRIAGSRYLHWFSFH